MSLQVWLPMTKDLRNQGIADVEITNNGATLDSAGKLGGCYYFNRSASNYLKISNPLTSSLNEISMAFWVKLPSNGSVNDQLVHIGNGSGWNNNRFTCFVRANNPFLVFVCGDGSSSTTYSCASSHLTLNQWTHIVCTYNNGTMRIYLNGILNKEYVTNIIPSFANTPYIGIGAGPNSTEPATAYLNDVRIYDHCLSPMEVKQLSQGLILHYPLSGIGGENLLTDTNNGGANWYWAMQVGDYTIAEEITLSGVKGCKFTRGSTAQSGWSLIYYNLVDESIFEESTNYTLSVDIYPSVSTSFVVSIRQTNAANSFATTQTRQSVVANTWNHAVFDLTTVATLPSSTSEVIYFQNMNSDTGVSYIFRNLKLEKGDKATPWCPNPSDALYTALGYDDGIEYDTSGYGNNGIKRNISTYSTNSPRYLASTEFNGTNSNILSGTAAKLKDEITVSLWVYMDDWNELYTPTVMVVISCTEGGGWEFYSKGGYPAFVFGMGENSNSYKTIKATIPLAEMTAGWHMITGTCDGYYCCIYIDGELSKSYHPYTTKTPLFYHASNSIIIGGEAGVGINPTGNYFKGKISDVRIYATALSAEDIQKLYTVSASIDSNGNAYSAAYVEG